MGTEKALGSKQESGRSKESFEGFLPSVDFTPDITRK
jgi:hypothetical protein